MIVPQSFLSGDTTAIDGANGKLTLSCSAFAVIGGLQSDQGSVKVPGGEKCLSRMLHALLKSDSAIQ
jgi:hypothetical protein